MDSDKLAAYQTLHEVLTDIAILSAPIAPFYMDRLYLDLTGDNGSVHYVSMPKYDPTVVDSDLEERMALAQTASSMVLALRKKVAIPVRQPLAKLLIPVISDKVRGQLEAVKSLILGEVNVKEVEFITDTTGIITKKIKPNFKTLGKIYGSRMKEIAAAFATIDQNVISAIQNAETDGVAYTLALPAGDVVLNPGDYQISSEDMPGWLVASQGSLTIALDVELTDSLRQEGVARELVNRIQNLRKDSDFDVTDRIDATVYASGDVSRDIAAALAAFREYVCSQTLAKTISLKDVIEAASDSREVEWGDGTIRILVRR